MDDIAEMRDELGFVGTRLTHKLMIAMPDRSYNMISASAATTILARIACYALGSHEACDRAEEFLLEQEGDEGLAEVFQNLEQYQSRVLRKGQIGPFLNI
ncbi:serine hydrolase [Paratractidigestivibacter sp.]|uniref:serine hydrolase n=1 Tax=Paratractidigestivibacter sp. TaxID=2847316 RepID=UPI002ABDCDFA|nr:serine hydrolase [Paratractidigestivibacter sp.]